ncbi:MAG: hypothetical protein IKV45_01960 [Firmicutes bacterium]|nr:hypothetical protein [Bacillota bacterium]
MSKRNHHRNYGININELAEALTQRGWQPPQRDALPPNMMMQGNPMAGMNQPPNVNNSLSALGGLLGAVNGGNMPQANMPPMQAPMPGMMPMQRQAPPKQLTEQDLLKNLFQQTIRTLKNE